MTEKRIAPLRKAFDLLRADRFAEALEQLQQPDDPLADALNPERRWALCVAEWYANARDGRFALGLLDAVDAISQLRHGQTVGDLAWLQAAAGFSMGIMGNVETGLQWIDRTIEAARASGDMGLMGTALSNRGAVLQMAGDLERGEQALSEALALSKPEATNARCTTLNNLAFARLTWARSLEPASARRRELAESALDAARTAESLAACPSRARLRAWALGNAGAALTLLDRTVEAEAAFREALPIAPIYPRVHVVVLAGYAGLLTTLGRAPEARSLLEQAWQAAPTDLLDSTLDLVLQARVKLELLAGDPAAATLWSERRYQRLEQQYRHRLLHAIQQAERLSAMERERALEREREQATLSRLRQNERESMLQDLHDGFGSQLVSARMAAESGALSQTEMAELLQDCISDLYLMVDTMSNEDGRLDDALRYLRNRLAHRLLGQAVELSWTLNLQDAPALAHSRLVQALRIVQEALNNALKYARADRIEITGRWEPAAGFVLAVVDDGVGLPALLVEGQGLRSMRARARSLAGALLIVSAGSGARVELRFPDKA